MTFWSIFSLLVYVAIFFSWYLFEKLTDFLRCQYHKANQQRLARARIRRHDSPD